MSVWPSYLLRSLNPSVGFAEGSSLGGTAPCQHVLAVLCLHDDASIICTGGLVNLAAPYKHRECSVVAHSIGDKS